GVGTALPVVLFALLLSAGVHSIGRVFQRLTQVEWWARRITGGVFILVGVYYCLTHIFGVLS
ncbi:sulfite exporter TauE/SafE family protein, partial [bacterium]|nr:sulfite exporter TauE/SafE family protein [bacterium]